MSRIIAILVLLITPVLAFSDTRVVEAEGSGYNRKQAIQSAKRSAVEKRIGELLSSHTKIENYQAICDTILSRTQKYISGYTKVPNSERTEYGLTYITIKAEVNDLVIHEDLDALKLLHTIKSLPRIMVVINELTPGTSLPQKTNETKKVVKNGPAEIRGPAEISGMDYQQSTTATVIETELIQKGFRLVDREQIRKIASREQAQFSDKDEAAKIGFRLGADIIITGTAKVEDPIEGEVYGVKQWDASCYMNLRMLRTDNGQLISTVSLGDEWSGKSKILAVNESLKQTTKKAAGKIIDDLLSFWQNEAHNTTVVEISITGMDNTKALSFEQNLQANKVIRSANLRYLEDTHSVFDVEIVGTIQDLRSILSKNNHLTIRAITKNRIAILYNKEPQQQTSEIKLEIPEPDISIEKASFQTLFPCIYSYYAKHAAGQVLIKNNSTDTITNATVSVTIPTYSTLPTTTKLNSIPPGNGEPFNFKLTLDTKAISKLTDKIQVQANIVMVYKYKGTRQKRQLYVPVTIESINAINWANPDMAASFITPKNTIIKRLSRRVNNTLNIDRDEVLIGELAQAAGLYNLLKSIGIKYVKDPNSTHGHEVIDNINYPVQTLELKSGDCDDTSILLASLLESIGIETSLIIYPDHVLVMLNTGIYEKNGRRISYNEKDYIIHNHKLWVPVETTQLQTYTFFEAWQSAVREFTKAVTKKQKITFVDIKKACKQYPHFDHFQQKKLPIKLNKTAITDAYTKDIATLRNDLKKGFIAAEKKFKNELKTNSSASILNRLGILHMQNGDKNKAEDYFKKAIVADSSYSPSLNNLANIYCLKGIDSLSVSTYEKAIKLKTNKGHYYLNKGLCLFTQNKTEKCLVAIRTGISKLGGVEEVEKTLGLDIFQSGIPLKGEEKKTPPDQKQPEKTITKREIKELIKLVCEEISQNGNVATSTKRVSPIDGLLDADTEQIEKIADVLWWDQAL